MARFNLQSMGIGLTFFIFIILFGANLISGHVNYYSISTNPAQNINYNGFVNNMSGYNNNAEDKYSKLGVSETDTDGVIGAFATIQSLLNLRGITTSVQKDTENNLSFIPKEVWIMVGIIMGIIFLTVIVGIIWKNSEGLNG